MASPPRPRRRSRSLEPESRAGPRLIQPAVLVRARRLSVRRDRWRKRAIRPIAPSQSALRLFARLSHPRQIALAGGARRRRQALAYALRSAVARAGASRLQVEILRRP